MKGVKALLTKLVDKEHVLVTGRTWFDVEPSKNQSIFIYKEIQAIRFWRKPSSSRRDVETSGFS